MDSIRDRFNRLQVPSRLAPSAGITATNQYGQRNFGGNRRNPPMMMRPTAPALSPMMREVLRQAQMKKAQAASGPGMPGVLPTSKPTPPPSQPSGFMSAFSQPLSSPVGQAISQAAIAGARASDYSPTPVSLGRVLAEMGAAASGGYQAGLKEQRAAEAADFARRMKMMQFAQKEREIAGTLGKQTKADEIAQVKLERDLRKDFETYSKPFTEAQRFFKDVINFSGEDNTSAQDLALVFSYMKLLDPGSVVREGEQYQVRDLGSIPDSFRVMLSKYGFFQNPDSPEGKMLLPQSVRDSIRQASMEKYSDALKSQSLRETEYTDIGKRADLNEKYFRPKIQQDGSIKNPYFVNSVEEGEAKAKVGEYFVVAGDGFYRKD